MANERKTFCYNCRKETGYSTKKERIRRTIRDKEYEFEIVIATCDECGEEVNIAKIDDANIVSIDKQYRKMENLISREDIVNLTKIYNIGKTPLSNALGFGEVTITRYVDGQVPSKEYSDILRKVLSSPEEMEKRLISNKKRIAGSAYRKAMESVSEVKNIFTLSPKMLQIISYIFKSMDEVTPLSLQKLLYFIQGESLAIRDVPMFEETCRAWVHGPVFPTVYDLFKDFSYNPIDDPRFAIVANQVGEITEEEKMILDLVLDTFGDCGGKTLERITHSEEPWINARKGYAPNESSNELISNESIKKFFDSLKQQYDISTKSGLCNYISDAKTSCN